jgi:hypothetical protein
MRQVVLEYESPMGNSHAHARDPLIQAGINPI